MVPANAIYTNGQVILNGSVTWPEGTPLQVHPVVERIDDDLSEEEVERLLDELADCYEASAGPDRPVITDEMVSRENIYSDHD